MTKFADQWEPNGPFGIVKDTDIQGGFHVVADDATRDAIPLLRQKIGMRVHVQATNKLWRLISVGSPLSASNFVVDNDVDAEAAGHHTGRISGTVVQNLTGTAVTLTAGKLAHRGTIFDLDALTAPTVPASGEQVLVFDTVTKTLQWRSHRSAVFTDLAVAFAAVTASAFTKFEPILPDSVRGANAFSDVLVGLEASAGPAHFADPHTALLWVHAYATNNCGPLTVSLLGGYAEITERVGLPGSVVGVDVATGTITGADTRFKRDFGVGDWVGLGGSSGATSRKWARVTGVVSDTSMTVASITAVTTPATYTRSMVNGPHAQTMSATLAGISGEIHNLHIRGITASPSADGAPLIEWGFAASGSSPFPSSDNAAPLGFNSNNHYSRVSNLHIAWAGMSTAGDYLGTCLQGTGRESTFENVTFEGYTTSRSGRGVSCLVNVDHDVYAGAGLSSVTFKKCIFGDMGGSGLTEKTIVRTTTTTAASGSVVFDSCVFSKNGSFTVAHDDTDVAPDISFLFKDCDVFAPSVALIKSRKTTADVARRFRFENCQITGDASTARKIAVVSASDLASDVPCVEITNSVVTSKIDYLGCSRMTGVISGAQVLNSAGSFDVYPMSGASLTGTPAYFYNRAAKNLKATTVEPTNTDSTVAPELLNARNIVRAWGRIDCSNPTPNLLSGVNVSSVSLVGQTVKVVLTFPKTKYTNLCIMATPSAGTTVYFVITNTNTDADTNAHFRIFAQGYGGAMNATWDLASSFIDIAFVVFGY